MAKVKVKTSVAKAITGTAKKPEAKPAAKKEFPSWTKTVGRKSWQEDRKMD